MSPVQAETVGNLGQLLRQRAAAGTLRYVALDAQGRLRSSLSGRELAGLARDGGERLRQLVRPKDGTAGARTVVLAIRDPLRFIESFFAVVCAGLVPVPAPGAPVTHPAHRRRLRAILEASGPMVLLTDDPELRALPEIGQRWQVCTTGEVLPPAASAAGQPSGQPSAGVTPVAYVQYTSGSVASPKPVALSHENVLAQLRQAAEVFGEHPASVAVTWVPLHHDMGLVTGVLRPLWSGYTSVLLDPFDFVRNPALWPRAMTDWEATHTSAPDFGYALCARKADPDGGYDLRRVVVARSAGELVRAATMLAFAERFRRAGFRYNAFKPSYGLAEATLTVTACPLDEPPRVLPVDGARLRAGEVVPVSSRSAAQPVVSCGRPLPGTRVRVLHPETGVPLDDRQVGEVWISGPQVSLSDREPHWLDGRPGYRTGDLGFLADSELYLVGRARERFQVAGENYYSGELEAVAGAVDPRLRPGRVAVFLAQRHGWRSSAPVVVAECRPDSRIDRSTGDRLSLAIVAAIGREVGLSVPCVWLTPAASLLVTTSGKLQRDWCRMAFETGSLAPIHRYERGLA